jgi:hypothetical protein
MRQVREQRFQPPLAKPKDDVQPPPVMARQTIPLSVDVAPNIVSASTKTQPKDHRRQFGDGVLDAAFTVARTFSLIFIVVGSLAILVIGFWFLFSLFDYMQEVERVRKSELYGRLWLLGAAGTYIFVALISSLTLPLLIRIEAHTRNIGTK